MNYKERAIIMARDGGYKFPMGYSSPVHEKHGYGTSTSYCIFEIFCDPDFWKAFTEENNKNKTIPWGIVCEDCGTTRLDCECRMSGRGARMVSLWLYTWRHFLEWLAEGKDIDGFFAEI